MREEHSGQGSREKRLESGAERVGGQAGQIDGRCRHNKSGQAGRQADGQADGQIGNDVIRCQVGECACLE